MDLKKLLLKDLSARLPYHVVVSTGEDNLELVKVDILNEKVYLFSESFLEFDVSEIKPYLRPMSDIFTVETVEEFKDILPFCRGDVFVAPDKIQIFDQQGDINLSYHFFEEVIDWLNKHHFDYRGLIEKGLAIEAPEGMYN